MDEDSVDRHFFSESVSPYQECILPAEESFNTIGFAPLWPARKQCRQMEIRAHAAQNLEMRPLAKLLLAGTSFAPILVTLAFVNWRAGLPWWYAASKLASAAFLVWLCHLLLKELGRRGEVKRITLSSAKPADKEILAFVLSYLIPLANTANVMKIDPAVMWFVLCLLLFLVYVSNAYQFNPLLVLFFGYHFYEVSDEAKIGYILITRRNIHHVSAITEVIEITDYVIMEHRHGS